MSKFFDEYYTKQQTPESNNGSGVLIVEVANKTMGKNFLKQLGKIFGKKSENVDAEKLLYDEVTKTAFSQFATKTANNFLSKTKQNGLTFVKNMYKGKLKNPEILDPNVSKVNSSVIFQLNNGGKLYLISLTDNSGITSNFIGTNNEKKVNDFFIEYFGKTFDLFMTTKKLVRKKGSVNKKVHKGVDKSYDVDTDEPREFIPEPSPELEPKPYKRLPTLGFVNTDIDIYEQLVDKLGNGTVGYGMFKAAYKYKNLIKRTNFENNWGRGYKYSLGSDMDMYLLRGIDNKESAKLLFNNKQAYSRAINLDMLPWFKPGTKLQWQELDIDNL